MSELEEIRSFLSQAKHENVIKLLQKRERELVKIEEDNARKQATVASSASESESKVEVKERIAPNPRVEIIGTYTPINDYSWDQGGYNSSTITIYVELEGVGSVKDNVHCEFTKSSFDLTVSGLNGKNYRLVNDNLEKDIDPLQSKYVVKKNKVVITLQKLKGEYSYDTWQNLTSKKTKEQRNESVKKDKDPMGGVMDMMKEMYESGDDNMKKIIGEAMLKSRSGEKFDPKMPDL